MKSFSYNFLLLIFLIGPFALFAQSDVQQLNGGVVDSVFDKVIPDPYRWMENPESERVKGWLDEQEKVTNRELGKLWTRYNPISNSIGAHRLLVLPDYEKQGPWYFYKRYGGGPSQVLCYRKKVYSPPDIAFDPNIYNGKNIYYLTGYRLSDTSRYLAVGITASGSDWHQLHVRDMLTQKMLDDKLEWVRSDRVVWWGDGFFYARFNQPVNINDHTEPLSGHMLCYHKLGDEQNKDDIISLLPDYTNNEYHFKKDFDGRFLIMGTEAKLKGQLYNIVCYKDLRDGIDADWTTIASVPEKSGVVYRFIDAVDSDFYFLTNFQAPRYRIVKINIKTPDNFIVVVPQNDKVIKQVSHIHHQLVTVYCNRGLYSAAMYDYKGNKISGISFDTGVVVHGFEGYRDDDEVLYSQNSFFAPSSVFRYDFIKRAIEPTDETAVGFDPTKYTTRLVSYHSADGTEIPMYLTYKKGLKITGNNPVILYGYGGFGSFMTPFLDLTNIIMFENNGILAVPLIRGGGEMGDDWHNDGKRLKKQNSFDDFIAAAEYLIHEGYTNKEKLAIQGEDNGGLLVGAVITQRPDLFKVAVSESGLFDMLRYDKFTAARYWIDEYGATSNKEDFNNLYSYSPLQHVKRGTVYPATLFITDLKDEHIPPFHTYKFATALQSADNSKPHLLLSADNTSHFGKYQGTEFNFRAMTLAFIYAQMGLPLNPF